MKRRTARTTPASQHSPVVPAVVTFFIGVIATLLVTRVLAQTNSNTIYGCVNKTNGNVRIVSSSDSCRNSENPINWSVQGPAGPQGPTGPQGQSVTATTSGFPFTCGTCFLYAAADRFKGKDLSYAQIWRTDFHGADLAGTIFKGAYLSQNNFSGANLSGADFTDVDTYQGAGSMGGDFSNANLQNANFTNANLQGSYGMDTATVTGAIWNNTTCPDGTDSNNDGNTCDGHFQ